jgi:CheY-like chemotaxis protein
LQAPLPGPIEAVPGLDAESRPANIPATRSRIGAGLCCLVPPQTTATSGGHTTEAQNRATALQVLEQVNDQQVELVLTDPCMPVMDGRQLAAAPARLHPALPIVFM